MSGGSRQSQDRPLSPLAIVPARSIAYEERNRR
jgi:hypothetical protein